jgi:hypothetical protein
MAERIMCPDCNHRVTDHTSNGCFWMYECPCKLTHKECLEKFFKPLDKRQTKG